MTLQRDIIQSLKANATRLAIETRDRIVTYSELSDQSSAVTGFLMSKGLTDETMIGIMTSDRVSLIAAIIGTLNAGCVFIPLDPKLPSGRLTGIVRDLDLRHVIIDNTALRETLEREGVMPYHIEDILSQDIRPAQLPDHGDDDAAYIYFTSGSTGTPKGIVGRNVSLKQFIHWEIETFGVEAGTRVSQLISPYFDAFLRDAFVPLVAGGTVCIPPANEDLFTPGAMAEWVDQQRIGIIHCVPSVFRMLCSGNLASDKFKSLRYVLMSGERIVPTELSNWYNVFEDRVRLVNLYGATETTMIRSYYEINPADVSKPRIPIGRPISGTELIVSNKNLEHAGPFIAGDLYIVSPFTTKGYLNNPEKTHEKFISMPHGSIAFKTGDKARRLADGQIDLIGREDRQIKLRGIRIELDEIEYVIMKSKLVGGVAVIDYTEQAKNSTGGKQDMLVSFIVKLAGSSTPNDTLETSVRRYLAECLPDYMIPSRIVVVDELPRMGNGKLNYRQLISMLETKTMVEPANETEQQLLQIWQEILGDKRISTNDSFQSVGGNSINMMSLITKIHRVLEVKVTLFELIQHLTIQQQAAFIATSRKSDGVAIKPVPQKAFYALSSAQERIYYSHEYKKNSTLFNMPLVWTIDGDLNTVRLENAFHSLVDRHEILRTGFKFINNRIVQVVSDATPFNVDEVQTEGSSSSIDFSNYVKPFDLAQQPLLRATIFHCADTKVLLIDMHHIVCDGISQALLLGELSATYRGETFAALPIQYRDFSEWELSYRAGEEYKRSRAFWLNRFNDEVGPLLFSGNTKAVPDGPAAGELFFSIEKKNLDDFGALAGEGPMNVFSALMSAYFLVLFETTGHDDIVVGTNSSGRVHEELRGLIGMFTKTLPIRQKIETALKIKDFVAEVQNDITGAIDNQLFDLVDLMAILNQQRQGKRELFNTMFIYQGASGEPDSGPVQFKPIPVAGVDGKFNLSLFCRDAGDHYNFRFEYLTSVFATEDVEAMADRFRSIIGKMIAVPDQTIAELLSIQQSEHTSFVQEDISFSF